jgi:DNA gyrase subunit A
VKEKYSEPRRTEIISKTEKVTIEDLIEEEEMLITVTKNGYIKRSPLSVFRKQQRGGKGVKGMTARDGDYIKDIFIASTHHYILIFTKKGRVFWLKVYDIPELGTSSKGQAISFLVSISEEDGFQTALAVKDFPEKSYLVMSTKKGFIKKTALSEFSSPRSSGLIAVTIDKDDDLIGVNIVEKGNDILLASRQGKSIRFPEKGVRPMGRTARGVRGINLKGDDYLVGMSILTGKEISLMTVTERGYGKQTDLKEFSSQSRGGSGVIAVNVSKKNGPVTDIMPLAAGDEFLLVSATGKAIRIKEADIPKIGRNTQGVRIMNLTGDDLVVGAAKVREDV